MHNTATALARANFVHALTFGSLGSGTTVDFTPLANLAGNPTQLLDTLDLLLLHGRMTPEMRTSITAALNAVPAGANQNSQRARTAVYLIGTSSQYQVQR